MGPYQRIPKSVARQSCDRYSGFFCVRESRGSSGSDFLEKNIQHQELL